MSVPTMATWESLVCRNDENYDKAIANDPAGARCGHCGGVNTHCDDIGFFYVNNVLGQYRAMCKPCWIITGQITCER